MPQPIETTPEYRSAYIEGNDAYVFNGKGLDDNPYEIETARAKGWGDGWQSAKDYRARFGTRQNAAQS